MYAEVKGHILVHTLYSWQNILVRAWQGLLGIRHYVYQNYGPENIEHSEFGPTDNSIWTVTEIFRDIWKILKMLILKYVKTSTLNCNTFIE